MIGTHGRPVVKFGGGCAIGLLAQDDPHDGDCWNSMVFFWGVAERVDSGSLDTSGRHSGKLAFFWGVGILISKDVSMAQFPLMCGRRS